MLDGWPYFVLLAISLMPTLSVNVNKLLLLLLFTLFKLIGIQAAVKLFTIKVTGLMAYILIRMAVIIAYWKMLDVEQGAGP